MIFHYQERDQTHSSETIFQREVQCRRQAAFTQQGVLRRNSSEQALFQGEGKFVSNPCSERKWERMINSVIKSDKINHEN